MYFVVSKLMFRRPLAILFQAGFLLGFFFVAEDGGDMFFRNTG
jgi:Na+-translocating ferredoxin:NAD+ oxidoreductase RnfD subunit